MTLIASVAGVFQSTPSPRRETIIEMTICHQQGISIHSLPKEGDVHQHLLCIFGCHFNPLPPQGGRHNLVGFYKKGTKISIHSLPKEGDPRRIDRLRQRTISIHSLPKEGDLAVCISCDCRCIISIHSLPKEGDGRWDCLTGGHAHFNPLPPQGGRRRWDCLTGGHAHFNPLPPQGGRPDPVSNMTIKLMISIHSLPKEGDYRAFQRTVMQAISIHSLPKEGDSGIGCLSARPHVFQSTPSPRRETRWGILLSITRAYFNPLPPQGGRPWFPLPAAQEKAISIHSLPKEGDSMPLNALPMPSIFQSTPSPRRETVVSAPGGAGKSNFNPLPPQGGRRGIRCA